VRREHNARPRPAGRVTLAVRVGAAAAALGLPSLLLAVPAHAAQIGRVTQINRVTQIDRVAQTPAALPRGCHAAPSWVDSTPDSTLTPALGVTVTSWHGSSSYGAPLRVVVAAASAAHASFATVTAPRLGSAVPTTALTSTSGAVVGLNGDYFTWGPTGQIPLGVQVSGGVVRFAPATPTRAVGLGADGQLHYAYVRVSGSAVVTAAGSSHRIALSAVNAPSSTGVSLVTGYGAKQPRRGGWFVLVRAGVAVSSSARDPGGPRGDDVLLVTSAARRALLSGVRAGNQVAVKAAVVNQDRLVMTEAVGSGAEIVRRKAVVADCTSTLGRSTRPRTVLAWNASDGRMWFVAVQSVGSGRSHPGNLGLTYGETADLIRKLGATDAALLDGGGSTTLAVRQSGRVVRVDAPAASPQRPVTDAMVWRLR